MPSQIQNLQAQNLKDKVQNHSTKPKPDLKLRTYRFALEIIRFLDSLPSTGCSREICRQLLRSATSVGANVHEARGSSSKKEFAQYFGHALRSSNETKFWLALLRDANKAPRQAVESLLQEAKELSNMLASSLLTLRGKR